MTVTSFRDPPAKQVVRERWNTPFLKYLHNTYGFRYRYMGLPGTDLLDVKLWADMIDEVIAFEIPCSGPDERAWVKQLRTNLRKLKIEGVAYFGSFEEVVILRKDRDGQRYSQGKVITLYNLDFCDEISSTIPTLEHGKQLWRFEALRQILQDQKECYRRDGRPSHFIILLTVRNQIEASKIRDFLSNNLLSETQSYYSACESEKPVPTHGPLCGTHAWSLKAFLYNTLRGYFTTPNVSALFFPIIKYIGTPISLRGGKLLKSPMLHWMLLCKFGALQNPTPSFYPTDFLSRAISLAVEETDIVTQAEPGEMTWPIRHLSSVEWFQSFKHNFFTNGI